MSITLKGGKEFNRKMKAFSEFAHLGAREANLATGFRILTDTRGELTLVGADDTGNLKASYHLESVDEAGGKNYWQNVKQRGSGTYSGSDGVSQPGWLHAPFSDDSSVIVGSNAPHAAVTEYGRTAGAKMPPPNALRGWARRHRMLDGLNDKEIESILFVIARAIKDNPHAPRPALFPSCEGNRDTLARLQAKALEKAAERISKAK